MIENVSSTSKNPNDEVAKQLSNINDTVSNIESDIKKARIQPSDEFVKQISSQTEETRKAIERQTDVLSKCFNKTMPPKPTRDVEATTSKLNENDNKHADAIDEEIDKAVSIHAERAKSIMASADTWVELDQGLKDCLGKMAVDFKALAENQRAVAIEIANIPQDFIGDFSQQPATVGAGLAAPVGSESAESADVDREQANDVANQRAASQSTWQERVIELLKELKPKEKEEKEKKKEEKPDYSLGKQFGLIGSALEQFIPKMMSGMSGLSSIFSTLTSMAALGALAYTSIKTTKAYTDLLGDRSVTADKQQAVANTTTSQVDKGANLGRAAQRNIGSAQEKIKAGNNKDLTQDEVLDVMRRNAGVKFNSIVDQLRQQTMTLWGLGTNDDTDLTNSQVSFTNAMKEVKSPDQVNQVLGEQINRMLMIVAKKRKKDHGAIKDISFEKLTVDNPTMSKDANKIANRETQQTMSDDRDAILAANESERMRGRTVNDKEIQRLIDLGKLERKGEKGKQFVTVVPSATTTPIKDGFMVNRTGTMGRR